MTDFKLGNVCRIQNLHISQTKLVQTNTDGMFVEFKIYISLKQQY